MPIYYFCGASNSPTGGIKVIYRHVDILNAHGIPAYVLHEQRGFRCTWFPNDTRIAYTAARLDSLLYRARNKLRERLEPGGLQRIPLAGSPEAGIDGDDVLVVPEKYGPDLDAIGRGIPRVILNQNGFLTFRKFSVDPRNTKNPYRAASVRGVLVNSEHVDEYLRYAFPGLPTLRFRLSIDPQMFRPHAPKRKLISYSQIKNAGDAQQVVNILKFRGVLDGWEVKPFTNLPQREVAALMRESAIFLSLGNREGFGLPAAEAMACGCLVVGYHGWGGREFFRPEFSYPVEDGDIIGFARIVEELVQGWGCDREALIAVGRRAADYIAGTYSPEREERDLIACWSILLKTPPAGDR